MIPRDQCSQQLDWLARKLSDLHGFAATQDDLLAGALRTGKDVEPCVQLIIFNRLTRRGGNSNVRRQSGHSPSLPTKSSGTPIPLPHLHFTYVIAHPVRIESTGNIPARPVANHIDRLVN